MKISDLPAAAEPTVNLLMNQGWMLAKIHGDGVIDLVKLVEDRKVRLFVDHAGWAGVPRTHETMLAEADLHDLGLKTPAFGAGREIRREALREGILRILRALLSDRDPSAETVLNRVLADDGEVDSVVNDLAMCEPNLRGRDALVYILDAAAEALR